MAEEDERSAASQSQKAYDLGHDDDQEEDGDVDDAEESDEDDHNVFYKASELIVSTLLSASAF